MKKLFGSLNNRFDENRYFNGTYNNLKVGTLATEYFYSDSHAYEVIEVADQKNITIRRLKATHVGNIPMTNGYTYDHDENAPRRVLTNRNGIWYQVNEYNLESLKKAYQDRRSGFKTEDSFINYSLAMSGLTDNQIQKVRDGKTAKKLKKINISFGVADEYFDYSF